MSTPHFDDRPRSVVSRVAGGALAIVSIVGAAVAADAADGHDAIEQLIPVPMSTKIDAAFRQQENGATLAAVREALDDLAGDPAADYARGAVQFLEAFEWLLQGAHRHGFLGTLRGGRQFFGPRGDILEWIANDQPAAMPASGIDFALRGFLARLDAADRTLAEIDADFTCAIELPAIRFDLNTDGTATSAEGLRSLFSMLPERRRWNPDERRTIVEPLVPQDLVVAFDRGDAEWLRGYCHLLSAVAEIVLAHDHTDWFDRTGFVLFPNAVTTHTSLPRTSWSMERFTGMQTPAPFDVTDVLAMLGNFQMPIDEPERMTRAMEHLRTSIAHGRAMWAAYDAETDDDREWIPNPQQTAAFHEVSVDPALRDAWLALLDEGDALLSGERLLRFWRGDGTQGIDVVKFFREPSDFNLLYWIQGSAATPYLREGEFTTPGTWAQIWRMTDQRIFRYSFWFN